MNNGTMPAAPSADIDTRMSREEFENKTGGGRYLPSYGLSKREHFAGLAMQNIINRYNPFESGDFDSSEYEIVAKNAVGVADALLAELDK